MKTFFCILAVMASVYSVAASAQQENNAEMGFDAEMERKDAETTCRKWAEIDEIPAEELNKFIAECVADYLNESQYTDEYTEEPSP